ncbi:MAG TPA: endolytic transglycosylase MltG [Ferrovibrio sp.]|uniref:endolytic transglycosylase MltG n=1 Tax=Ferrovibrio sp. TaxID=1917215 RepID=UPI002ED5B442
MKRIVRPLLAIALAAVLIFGGGYIWFVSWLDRPGPAAQETVIVIPRGSGVTAIARLLTRGGVVSNARLLEFAASYTGTRTKLKAGEYQFAPGETPRGVLEQIAAGRVLIHRLTIPEGLTTAEIRQLIAGADALSGDWPQENIPEGSLLPETYHYIRGDSRSDLVHRMQQAEKSLLAELWAKRAPGLPLANPEQAIVLASIVEAETPIAEERPRVAAVYLNRLKKGMRLQADPTVAYGLTKGEHPLDRPLSHADLAAASPWNTYLIDGLPPTPINHPGRASLAAVLQPEQNDYLFFVANGRGGHVFAETYEQHLRNVAAYRAERKR